MLKRQRFIQLSMIAYSIVALNLTGCVRHYSSDLDRGDAQFYGAMDNSGDKFVHEAPPSADFSRGLDCLQLQNTAAPVNYYTDQPLNLSAANDLPDMRVDPILAQGLLLSPGDLIEVNIEDGEGFSGRYIVDNSGAVKIPQIGKIAAAGDTTNTLETEIELALVRNYIFQPATAAVTIQVLNWSAIEVSVAGAVFQPGRVLINDKLPRATQEDRLAAAGDYSPTRLLSEALRAASGIRPDAKLDQVMLLRKGWQVQVDMTGVLTGKLVKDYPLVAGDRVIVPSTGCFQPHLVRPSQITPKGFRVFMSNLIDSAGDNTSAAIGKYSTSLPYGTRLLQAAVSANCVGGKDWTNAPRRIVLSSKNPLTGQIQVIERSVEKLLTMPSKNSINPYLMPNDAVACYDSNVTNLRDIAKAIAELITPFKLL
ncbi:polysaccharide biosynthesis/export family protein [Psychrobium sp. nBUS_13]|uniref:polysaccharide biosynthesis/export family protein n=1 Tax=Psychrobium sp. nBUS_13 TaxID=3395319 RepID=UPI003EBC5A71